MEGLIVFTVINSALVIGVTALIQKIAKNYHQPNLEKFAVATIAAANVIALLQNANTAYHLYFT